MKISIFNIQISLRETLIIRVFQIINEWINLSAT